MSEHTKTPYHVGAYNGVYDEQERSVLSLKPDAEAKANAEFIVKACNAHDALVEMLKRAKGVLWQCLSADYGCGCCKEGESMNVAFDAARALIAEMEKLKEKR